MIERRGRFPVNPEDQQFFVAEANVVEKHDAQPHLDIAGLMHSGIEESEMAEDFFANQGGRRFSNAAQIELLFEMLAKQAPALIERLHTFELQMQITVVSQ